MKQLLAGVLAAGVACHAVYGAEPLTAADFVAKASEAGMAEMELGKLASQKAASPDVRQYAERMVTDHGKADTELKALAAAKKLTTAKALNPAHQKARESLRQKTGADFYAAFAQQMVTDHNDAVALFSAAGSLADQELAGF